MATLSVIIPTHNRPECAIYTIRAVLSASPDIEVIVSDTSDVDSITSAFIEAKPSRLKLLRPNRPLNVVENFNMGLEAATGDFLVFIGDDDLVSPAIVEVASWARREEVEAVAFSFPVSYYWPGFVSTTRWKAVGASMVVAPYDGTVRELDTVYELKLALNRLGAGVLNMPRAYAGLVSRSLVTRVINRYGKLFGGVSPDIYSAALISLEAKRAFKLDFPIIIPGVSRGSTSGQSARGEHVGGLRENAHIGAFSNLVWDNRVPEYYGVPTVWGFSLLKAIENQPEWLQRADFPHLYLKCLITDPKYKKLIWHCFKEHARTVGWLKAWRGVIVALHRETIRVVGALYSRFSPISHFQPFDVIHDIQNTEQALAALEIHYRSNSVQLTLPVQERR